MFSCPCACLAVTGIISSSLWEADVIHPNLLGGSFTQPPGDDILGQHFFSCHHSSPEVLSSHHGFWKSGMHTKCFYPLGHKASHRFVFRARWTQLGKATWLKDRNDQEGSKALWDLEIWDLCLLDLAMHGHSSAGSYDSHSRQGAHTSSVEVSEASLPVFHLISSWQLHWRPLGTTQAVSLFPLTRCQLFSHLS